MKKKQPKRSIRFEGIDKEIQIGKASCIHGSEKEFFIIEKMKDGKWRVTWTDNMFEDLSDVEALTIIRETKDD